MKKLLIFMTLALIPYAASAKIDSWSQLSQLSKLILDSESNGFKLNYSGVYDDGKPCGFRFKRNSWQDVRQLKSNFIWIEADMGWWKSYDGLLAAEYGVTTSEDGKTITFNGHAVRMQLASTSVYYLTIDAETKTPIELTESVLYGNFGPAPKVRVCRFKN